MNERNFDKAAVDRMLASAMESPIDAAAWRELDETLAVDDAACDAYLDQMTLHAMLEREFGGRAATIAPQARNAPARRWRLGPMAAAAMVLLGAVIAVVMMGSPRGGMPAERAARRWAIVTDMDRAKLADREDGPALGAGVGDEPIELVSGSMQLMLNGGAVVDLVGPAKMALTGSNAMTLMAGAMSAWVPARAHGFAVTAPHAKVVDLGTEFGMRVRPSGRVELSVLRGHVQLTSGGRSMIVGAQEAYAIAGEGEIESVAFETGPRVAAWYALDGDGRDRSGNGLDLTAGASPFVGEAGPMSGMTAATFAKTDGRMQLTRKVSAEELANFSTTRFSIEAWVRDPDLLTSGDHDGVMAYRNQDDNRFQFTILGPAGAAKLGAIRLDYIRDDTGAFYAAAGSDALTWTRGVWYHVVVSYDANTSAPGDSIIRIFRTALDGASATQCVAELFGQPDIRPLTAGGVLTVGGFENNPTRSFGGSLSGVGYINHCLSEREIAAQIKTGPAFDTTSPQPLGARP